MRQMTKKKRRIYSPEFKLDTAMECIIGKHAMENEILKKQKAGWGELLRKADSGH